MSTLILTAAPQPDAVQAILDHVHLRASLRLEAGAAPRPKPVLTEVHLDEAALPDGTREVLTTFVALAAVRAAAEAREAARFSADDAKQPKEPKAPKEPKDPQARVGLVGREPASAPEARPAEPLRRTCSAGDAWHAPARPPLARAVSLQVGARAPMPCEPDLAGQSRNWHNLIKNVLLSTHVGWHKRALDLGCFRSPDVAKWAYVRPECVVFQDLVASAVLETERRWKAAKYPYPAAFLVADFNAPPPRSVRAHRCDPAREKNAPRTSVPYAEIGLERDAFDVVVCHFAAQYAFRERASAAAFLGRISAVLKRGGRALLSLPDGDQILAAVRLRRLAEPDAPEAAVHVTPDIRIRMRAAEPLAAHAAYTLEMLEAPAGDLDDRGPETAEMTPPRALAAAEYIACERDVVALAGACGLRLLWSGNYADVALNARKMGLETLAARMKVDLERVAPVLGPLRFSRAFCFMKSDD